MRLESCSRNAIGLPSEGATLRDATCVIIIGYSGAGKTTIGGAFGHLLNAQTIELGSVVRTEAGDGDYRLDPLGHAQRLFRAGEHTRFAKVAAGLVQSGRIPIFVGPRRVEEVTFLKHYFVNAKIVALHANAGARHARRVAADNGSDPRPGSVVGRYQHRDRVEKGWGLDRAFRMADLHMDGTRPFQAQLEFLRLALCRPSSVSDANR